MRQPALDPAPEPDPRQASPARPPRRAMTRMTDRTWQLVTLTHWHQPAPGTWHCRLEWGDRGTIRRGWHAYDPERLTPWPPGQAAAENAGQ